MTCLRQERGKGRSVTPVMRTGVCILLCFLGCSIWILRGKRGPQHYPVLPVPCPLPHQSRCKGHRWGLLATDKPLGWGGGTREQKDGGFCNLLVLVTVLMSGLDC